MIHVNSPAKRRLKFAGAGAGTVVPGRFLITASSLASQAFLSRRLGRFICYNNDALDQFALAL